MSTRFARPLAWGLWLTAVAAIVVAGVLSALYPFSSIQETSDPFAESVWSMSWVGFGLVGAMIVSQRPRNRIGWVLIGITFMLAIAILTPSYGRTAFYGGSLPLGAVATWLGAWTFFPATGLVVALLLLYPSGVLAQRRHRIMAWLLVVLVGLRAALAAFTPGPIEGDAPPFNPLGIAALEDPTIPDAVSAGLVIAALLVLVDFIFRFWRSRGTERMQFRWLAWAAAAFPVLFSAAVMLEDQFLDPNDFDPVVVVFFVCGNGLAAAIGIAVTRHGLYEINRVISRTVSYLVLTAVLVAVYLGAVTLLTAATAPITRKSPLAVAAATLLAAAVFGPARRRIQGVVDRRFNRARYDAAVTVDAYRGRLRDEVDLETVATDLVHTVLSVMQPAATHLWLAGAGTQKILPGPTAVTVSERRSEKKGT